MALPRRILSLSDSQLEAVMAAAHPLQPSQRPLFLEALARQLNGIGELGDGAVHRAIRDLQRSFWDPPDLSGRDPRHHRLYRHRATG